MFGYIAVNNAGLSDEEKARYRAHYCGLCRSLMLRHGQRGRATLSNDMTFLSILLCSLYEPKEDTGSANCPVHPIKKGAYVCTAASEYAADMNIVLAYFKCLDDLADDHNPVRGGQAKLLRPEYEKVQALYPDKCRAIEECLREISALEKEPGTGVDPLCNLSGQMLGHVFAWKDDIWAKPLRAIGAGLGRFIYFMDAYEDYDADQKLHRFNPLVSFHDSPDYEAFCLESLHFLVAEATAAFDLLPLEQDLSILQNVLYSGVWSRYARLHARDRKAKEQTDGE